MTSNLALSKMTLFLKIINTLEMMKCHFFLLTNNTKCLFYEQIAEYLKVVEYALNVNRREISSRYMMGRIYGRLNVTMKFAKINRAKTVKS